MHSRNFLLIIQDGEGSPLLSLFLHGMEVFFGGGVEEGPFGAVRAASFILRFVVRKGNQRGGDQSGISQ